MKTLRALILAFSCQVTCVLMLPGCGMLSGTEVGNGAKEPPTAGGAGEGPMNDQVQAPAPGLDNVKSILSASCHSLIAPSRDGMNLRPYSIPGQLPVKSKEGIDESRAIEVTAGAPVNLVLAGVPILRDAPDAGLTQCLGEESINAVDLAGGAQALTLTSRVKVSETVFEVRIRREQSAIASKLTGVEIIGTESFRVIWESN